MKRFFVAATALGLCLLAGAAHAHRPYLKTYLISADGQENVAFLEVKPTTGGRVKIDVLEPLPGSGTGTLVMDAVLNRVPIAPLTYPIGAGQTRAELGIETANQDKIEITDIRILDDGGNVWAEWGGVAPPFNKSLKGKYLAVTAIVYVADTASDVAFTRGGDTNLLPNGFWTCGFDALRSRATGEHLTNTGNRCEIEFSHNGGPWEVHSVSFDVKSGKSQPSGRPGIHFNFEPGDRVRVKRVEVFDKDGNMFAKIGVRMGSQGRYRHALDRSVLGEDEPHTH